MSAGTPSEAPSSNEAWSGSGIACAAGTTVYSAAVPQRLLCAASSTQTRSPMRLGADAAADRVDRAGAVLVGYLELLRLGADARVTRLRDFQSVGLTPEIATLTRTSPGPARGSPTSRT